MIITNSEKDLRIKCEDVKPEEIGELREKLEKELQRSNLLGRSGIGLAAPQIGIAKKMAIVRLDRNGQYDLEVDLVNARIDSKHYPMSFFSEGCLSFPGRLENTTRFNEIHVVDNLVFPNAFIATGMLSIVCQHELDHLNEILFFDHAIKPITNIGSNQPCPCGRLDKNGKKIKYKKCCGK